MGLMENEYKSLASLIAQEGSKSCTDVMAEIAQAISIDVVKQAAEFLVQYECKEIPMVLTPETMYRRAITIRGLLAWWQQSLHSITLLLILKMSIILIDRYGL